MPTPLTNDRWGYESNCFVCEATNTSGLRIPFHLDDEAACVFAEFRLGPEHSGAPTLVHGGLSLAVLDEAQAWACIAIAGHWGMTRHTQASFDGPVHVDRVHRVEATVEGVADDRITTSARILDGDGTVLVRSGAEFASFGLVDVAHDRLGLRDEHRHLLD